jgi:AGZA family xanthine/uracil permease-like MFS transporter
VKAFVKGDLDGFFALALDNLINLLLISSFCLGVLKFSAAVFYDHILPAAAVSLLVGNLFYARQARVLARREQRDDVCALPYGISLFTVLAYSLLVMLPAQQAALARGLAKPAADLEAWRAGIAACLASGVIELLGGLWVDKLRRHIPRAALLATPAMVGLLFISGDFFFKCIAYPDIGFVTLGLICAIYYGRMKLKGSVPASLLVIVLGTLIAWLWHRQGSSEAPLVPVGRLAAEHVGFHFPVPVIGDLAASLRYIVPYLAVSLPMGLLGLVGSLQCLESAEAAGDRFAGRPALVMNGLGTLAAALCGSPYPTTLYYGHPGWKAIGARAGYSTLNAAFFTLVLLTGTFSYIAYAVPVEAGMAILVWIGATMFIQAFSSVSVKHYPAVAIGMLPPVAGFAALVTRHALAGAGVPFSSELLTRISETRNYALRGVFAGDAGYIFMSILWAGAVVEMTERRFNRAALWLVAAAVFSALGFMHATTITPFDVIGAVQPAWPWVAGYLAMAAVLAAMPLIARPTDDPML